MNAEERIAADNKLTRKDREYAQLLDACGYAFVGLCNMSTFEFERGADKPIRDRLARALRFAGCKVQREYGS